MMEKTIKAKLITPLISALLMSVSGMQAQANIFKGDNFFKAEKYQQAKEEYLASAQIGSPNAYYQLGTIYYKGLGEPQNYISALVWFSLAAEYEFSDSKQVSEQMLAALPAEQLPYVKKLVKQFKQKFGKQIVQQTYYPEILVSNLTETIHFSGEGKPDSVHQTDFEAFGPVLEEDTFEIVSEELDEFDDGFGFETIDSEPQNNSFTMPDFFNRPYFLIADYDLAPDGTARNITPIQTIGYTRKAIQSLRQLQTEKPLFKGQPAHFINRINMGMASYGRFEMADTNQTLYDRLRRLARKLKNSTKLEDRYQYAMALTNFSWLPQEKTEAETLLKQVAKAGHPLAQYEYGLKLYREQTDIAQAIYWLASASKFGLDKAEYRLGHILQTSPWVVNDEAKALFWYLSAAEKQFQPAMLKAAEIKLLTQDKDLFDQPGAIELLNELAEQNQDNPEYHYLYAVSRLSGKHRDLKVAFASMRKAINLAESYYWDVSDWHAKLSDWTRGKVQITSES